MSDGDAQLKKFQKELSAGTVSLVLLAVLGQADEPMYGYQIAKRLERDGQGLNLTDAVRDGILHHTGSGLPRTLEGQIVRLVGTTETTIASVRDRTHWNASTLTPMDPVTLGLCSQIELDFEVQRAAKEKPAATQYGGATLLPASETTRKDVEYKDATTTEKQRDDMNVDAVFAKLKTIGGKKAEDE